MLGIVVDTVARFGRDGRSRIRPIGANSPGFEAGPCGTANVRMEVKARTMERAVVFILAEDG